MESHAFWLAAVVCCVAPEGLNVYSLRFFLYSEAPSERNRFVAPAIVSLQVWLLTERDPWMCARSYKHLAPLERKGIHLLSCELNFTNEKYEK